MGIYSSTDQHLKTTQKNYLEAYKKYESACQSAKAVLKDYAGAEKAQVKKKKQDFLNDKTAGLTVLKASMDKDHETLQGLKNQIQEHIDQISGFKKSCPVQERLLKQAHDVVFAAAKGTGSVPPVQACSL